VNWHLFAGFLVITMVLVLTPGPIVTLVISTGATRGVRAGLVTVAGTSTGNVLLLASIALGLNWVLSHTVYIFELLRWIGAAYLIWLGVQAWRNAGRADRISSGKQVQFVDPTRPAAHQIAVMCAVSALLAALSDACWAIASGLGRAWFMKPARAKLLGRASGLTLIGGGMWLSLARRPAP
jgi:homoserine/homoserine lactone efflux protein